MSKMKALLFLVVFVFYLNSQVTCQTSNSNIDGLKFSKALFISLKSERLKDFVAFDTTVIIEKGKVWNITSVKSFMVKSDFNPYENEISLWINDQIVYYYKSKFDCPIWLPEGKYRVKLMSYLKDEKNMFISYLSGIEYSIENSK